MAELARDLGISTKTLYRLFPTKADLVHRLLERWAGRFEQDLESGMGSADELPFAEQLLRTSEVWRASRRRFSAQFWDEVERDYPASAALLQDARERLRAQVKVRLGPHIKPGLHPELALELFDAVLAGALDPAVRRRSGVDGRTAVRNAVRIWSSGALAQPLRARTAPNA
jgi:AcrR family transcriptional regulator